MKKFLFVIFCITVMLVTGCESNKDRESRIMSEAREAHKSSLREDAISREAEIEEVDKWGVSLDDVERLSKQAIRKHENTWDYRQDYKKAIRETDDFLEDVESGRAIEYSLEYFLNKYNAACEAGINYIESWVDVKSLYDLYMTNRELDKLEKDVLRSSITLYNERIQKIKQSQTDMEAFLKPIIDEERKLTSEEIKSVLDIYQVLTDNTYSEYH